MDNIQKLQKIREQLKKEGLDAVFVSSVSNIIYLTGFSNFSVEEREGFLLIMSDSQYVITDGRYSEAIEKNVPLFKLAEISLNSPFPKLIKDLAKKHKLKNIGIEERNLTVAEHKKLSVHFQQLKDFSVHSSRSVKTAEEVKLIEKACQIGDLAFEYILKKVKVGITEQELADEMIRFFRKHQVTTSFDPIVAFEANSSVPHHQTGLAKLEKKTGQFILLDFGAKFQSYCSDMTRTIFFGKPTIKQMLIYQTVLEAQQKAIEYLDMRIKNNEVVKASQVDKIARNYILKKGFSSFSHSLGHGIGLEVHEYPSLGVKSKAILKPGMVFSIEPGIYSPGFGGVRIEDLFVIEPSGLRQLTQASKNLIKI